MVHEVEGNSTGKRLYLSMIQKYTGRMRIDFNDNFQTKRIPRFFWEWLHMRKQSIPGLSLLPRGLGTRLISMYLSIYLSI